MDLPLLLCNSLHPMKLLAVFLVCCHLVSGTMAEYLLTSFTQVVGAGNYTHFKLTRDGDVRLVLNTLGGDADLYISDTTLHPDFENYELQATSCGEDMVLIPEHFKRPIGISIYGHPSYDLSHFKLDVYVEDIVKGGDGGLPANSQKGGGGSKKTLEGEDEDSLLWNIFVGVLKIIFDVLL